MGRFGKSIGTFWFWDVLTGYLCSGIHNIKLRGWSIYTLCFLITTTEFQCLEMGVILSIKSEEGYFSHIVLSNYIYYTYKQL